MQTDTFPQKFNKMLNKLFSKLMVASGMIALVWILAFLLVAIIDK